MKFLAASIAAAVALAAALPGRVQAQEEPAPEEAPIEHKLTKPPKLVKFVEAEYPPDKKAAGTQASVTLEIEIAANGTVAGVKVTIPAAPAAPDFDAAAVAAVKQFVFEPAEIDGKPAPVKLTYRYDFTIKEEIVELKGQVNFEGRVLERFKGAPLQGVKVKILDLDVEVGTDEQGSFAFQDVPAGTHQIELSASTLVTVKTEEEIVRGKKKTVTYKVELKEEGVDDAEVVRAPRIKKESVEVSIRTEEARRVPGTQGDTLKVVQNLPGVGRSSFGSGQLVVWGSSPKDTRVYVNGIEIPSLYHGGGLRSTVSSDLVKSIDLSPGAYGADYGRGLGGLVKVETRKLPEQGTHGFAAADVIDSSAMLSFAASKDLRIGVAGRYSYLDQTLKLVGSEDFSDYVPIPRYWDGQVLAQLSLGKDEDLTFIGLASDDKLRRTIASSDPQEVRSEDTHVGFWRAGVRYARIMPDGASFSITPSVGHDTSDTVATFGPVPTRLELGTWRVAVRGGYRRKLSPSATMTMGLDMQTSIVDVTRFGSINTPAREGDITIFGQPPGDEVNADDWTSTQIGIAPYGFVELSFGRLSITPGLRVEPTLIDGSRLTPVTGASPSVGYRRLDLAVDPRLSLSFKWTPRLALRAAGGLYHQPPDPADLSAVFGNPTLTSSQALHLSAGASYKLTGTLTFEAVGFAKELWDLAARSEEATPPLAQALDQEGVGRSYGGQVLLRQELWHGFFGWVTYSLIRSERKDHPDQEWRLFDYDQTHVLAVLMSWQLGMGWELGGRFRYTTGVPRTPVTDAFYDARDDTYQPLMGKQNSIRVPAFYQVDARLEKQIVRPTYKLSLFLDVQNLTNRQNPEEIVYTYDFSQRKYITGLPTLAVVGARVEF